MFRNHPTLSRVLIYSALGVLITCQGVIALQHNLPNNGFDLSSTSIPAEQIFNGGPPRDGIPAIDEPRFLSAKKAHTLKPDDQVLGVLTPRGPKAYPLRILDRHEIVNDHWDDDGLLISYCPLCGTGMAFRVSSRDLEGFGVSGLLFNSDVLLYDRATQSLWSQIMSQAISGSRRGEKLQSVALQHTTWSDWSQRYPNTLVLSRDTGYQIDYDRIPYVGYAQSETLYFPVQNRDRRRHPKARVIGLVVDGEARVWPFDELAKAHAPVLEELGGKIVQVHYDSVHGSAKITDSTGELLPAVSGFWFAWMAFHPQSSIYSATGE